MRESKLSPKPHRRRSILSRIVRRIIIGIYHLKGWKKQNEVQEALFKAYFTDGVFLDEEKLIEIANDHNVRGFEEAVKGQSLLEEVERNVQKNYSVNRGHGVPFFIVNASKVRSPIKVSIIFINTYYPIICNCYTFSVDCK